MTTEPEFISVHISEKASGEHTEKDSADSLKTLREAATFSKLFSTMKFKLDMSDALHHQECKPDDAYSIIYKNRMIVMPKHVDGGITASGEPKCLWFIHGVGGNLRIWQRQLEFFSTRGYEIIAVDLIGHGESSAPTDPKYYQFSSMAEDILFVFDMFARKSNIVIGHSYGCSFSTYLSQTRKECIEKLILINGGSPHQLGISILPVKTNRKNLGPRQDRGRGRN